MDWKKSSFSNGNGGNNCVEVAKSADGRVLVRDSKAPIGCTLTFTAAEWMAFVRGVRNREFDVQD